MELHQLRYFAAVARTGNFTRAAEACHVSQPSLSQQIIKLEDEVGAPLFERRRDRASLTLAGELLLRHATRVLSEIDEVGSRMREIRRMTRGRLRVGAIPTIAPFLLPGPLAQLKREHPGVEITLHEHVTTGLLAALQARDLDLVIASHAAPTEAFASSTLFQEPLLLALPAGHALERLLRVTMDDLHNERFIVLSDEHCLSSVVSSFCRQNDLAPNIICQGAQIQTVLAMVAADLGISLFPAMACRQALPLGLSLRPLKEATPRRDIIAYFAKNEGKETPLVQKLLQLLRAEATVNAPFLPVVTPAPVSAPPALSLPRKTGVHRQGISSARKGL